MRTIYFDYNATTPLDSQVREAMLPFLGEVWGNPSSVHHVGQRARAALDDARDQASRVLKCRNGLPRTIWILDSTESLDDCGQLGSNLIAALICFRRPVNPLGGSVVAYH